ncbi:MAG: S1C family serine protease [Treponema socranskii subsp. buccale]|uniref:S1C family serine protease n=1 Tax=Treponema socranskii TaxID=53419 RepID=UPI0020A53C66|nr:trypsin-like peptidase domain-containing protein [Treponema socranskii]UTD03334.1 trypsin-like peptidase domain-containing protein [Treponema socranskii subsp. buccale]
MKLYSKTQLLCAAIGAAVFAAALAVFIDRNFSSFASLAVSRTQEENLSSEKIDFNNRTEEETPSIFEDTGVLPVRPIADASRFTESEQQNIGVYDKCAESVVNISTKIAGINWFLEPTVEDGGTGSGSIIDKRGYIVTNVHVIQNASEIYVSLSDGTQYEAEIVGQDSESDLAVIKFTPPAGTVLKTISFGDSSKLKVGQKVIAIGNPFGLDRTMTTGIVSGLARPVRNSNNRIIRNMIQTDAAINPGNSGGPLLDTAGRMVGINTMIVSSSGSSAGVGFAIPAETAVRVVSDLIRYGRVNRGVVQMSIVQLNRTIVQYAGLDVSAGVLVSEVTKNGNADKAGIRGGTQRANYGRSIIFLGGDIVTKIDDIAVASLADYFSALEDKRPGDTVSMTIRRKGRDLTVKVTLAPPQASN